jgi:hypothetical protein
MPFRGRVGLTKEQVRRIVLAKLRIVYRDWRLTSRPFGRRDPNAARRREDAQSFETALVAALLGGLSEAIENNKPSSLHGVQAQRRKREEQILAMAAHDRARGDCGPVVTRWRAVRGSRQGSPVPRCHLLRHFSFHREPLIGPSGPSASPSSLVWVW